MVPGPDAGSVLGLIDKLKLEDAPSDIVSIGRYVLTPDAFEILRRQEPGEGEEIQLADAFNKMAENSSVFSVLLLGRRYDCGWVRGFLEAPYLAAEQRDLL